jgi:hypothetical protein
MNSFDIDIDVFEEELEETLADLVDVFFERWKKMSEYILL